MKTVHESCHHTRGRWHSFQHAAGRSPNIGAENGWRCANLCRKRHVATIIDIDAAGENREEKSEQAPIHSARRDKSSSARRRIARLGNGGDAAKAVGDKYSRALLHERERGGRRVRDIAQKGDVRLIVDAGVTVRSHENTTP